MSMAAAADDARRAFDRLQSAIDRNADLRMKLVEELQPPKNREERRFLETQRPLFKGVRQQRKDEYSFGCSVCDLFLSPMTHAAANTFSKAHHDIHRAEEEAKLAIDELRYKYSNGYSIGNQAVVWPAMMNVNVTNSNAALSKIIWGGTV